MAFNKWENRKVLVMGLGNFGGGEAVARYLAEKGATLTITDLKSEKKLALTMERLRDLPIRYVLGEHREADFLETETLIVSPAVKPGNAFLQLAIKNGVEIQTEIGLFAKEGKGKVFGVTGSKGKSTTASLLHQFLEKHPDGKTCFFGGNIGKSLLPDLDSIEKETRVVLELSSFQLHWLRKIEWSPDVALFTSLFPDHLDWHGSFKSYKLDKEGILEFQEADDLSVLQENCTDFQSLANSAKGQLAIIGARPALGAVLHFDKRRVAFFKDGRQKEELEIPGVSRLKGEHNFLNLAQAAFSAWQEGVPVEIMENVLENFQPLEHRLEEIGKINEAVCINDSMATSPEASSAAIKSFSDKRIFLIAGGSDKGLDYTAWGKLVKKQVHKVFLLGAIAKKMAKAIGKPEKIVSVLSLEEAVSNAKAELRTGDVLLLSPATASYDMFADFRERGENFREQIEKENRDKQAKP